MSIPFDPDEIVSSLGAALISEVNLVSGTFIKQVVPDSPVLTGHFRRNWQVNIGVFTGQELPGVDFVGQSTVQNGLTKLEVSKRRNPFLPVMIENNVPYGPSLNAGSSKQAPAMFVETALASALRIGQNQREDL